MDIGSAVKSVRLHQEFTQGDLSEATGLSQTAISQIENGVKIPSAKSIDKICKALGVPEDVLYILGIQEADFVGERKIIYDRLYDQIREAALLLLDKHKRHLII